MMYTQREGTPKIPQRLQGISGNHVNPETYRSTDIPVRDNQRTRMHLLRCTALE